MTRRKAALLVGLALVLAIAIGATVYFDQTRSDGIVRDEDITRVSQLEIVAPPHKQSITGIKLVVLGFLNGNAELTFGANSRFSFRGNVNHIMFVSTSSDRYTLTYTPIDATEGYLAIEYRFVE